MKFHEKLRRRVHELGLNKTKAARGVGLPASTISNYLVKENSLPRIDIAFKIAKAVGVPLEWLADDSRDWPPPDKSSENSSLRRVHTDDLMAEVVYRQRQLLLELVEALEAAEKVNWRNVRQACQAWKQGEPLPPVVTEIIMIVAVLTWKPRWIDIYNPRVLGVRDHAKLVGSSRAVEDFKFPALENRLDRMYKNEDYAVSARLALSMTEKRP